MDVLVGVFFHSQKQIVAHGKSKVTTTKEQRITQAEFTTINTERGAHRTAHFRKLLGNLQPVLYIFQRLPSDAAYSQHCG